MNLMDRRRRAEPPFSWIRRRWLPPRTVRLRLTLLYGALFIASGTALLAITYALVWHATYPRLPSAEQRQRPQVQAKAALEIHEHAALMHQLLVSFGIGLAVTAVLSIALGWLVAGRVLRPLRAMTAATQRISDHNLHQRLAVPGPDDELKHLGDTIDDLLARLEGAFDAQRQFVANASHELRTPLTMMRTALDVATNKPSPPPPEVTALAGKVRLGLDKADRLVENFLTLARAQDSGALRTSTAALDQLAATLVAEHRDMIGDQRLTVEQNHHRTLVCGNQALLTHLIDNLVDNAVRHNQPGGWIRIATDTDADAARLVVENSGPILDQSLVGELLQPFRRLAPDRGHHRNRSRARAGDRRGHRDHPPRRHGSTRPTRRRAAGHRHPSARCPTCAHRGSAGMRILVVEDVHSLADDIAEGLRDQGFAVDVATTDSRPPPNSKPTPTRSSCSTETCPASTATPFAG